MIGAQEAPKVIDMFHNPQQLEKIHTKPKRSRDERPQRTNGGRKKLLEKVRNSLERVLRVLYVTTKQEKPALTNKNFVGGRVVWSFQ